MRLRVKARSIVVVGTMLVTFLVVSCVREVETLRIGEVVNRRSELSGTWVRVRGFVVVDALDYPNFVEQIGPPSELLLTKSIDLVPGNPGLERELLRSNGACIIASGIFHLYGPNEVHLGNLVSDYGQLQLTSLHKCAG